MNRISSDKEALAIQLFLKGNTIRMVSTDVGIVKRTAETLRKKIIEGYGVIYCPCDKVSGHKGWCSYMMSRYGIPWRSQLKDIATFNIYIPTRPRYERPDIADERETELPLLVNRRFIRSFDAPINGYDDESLHSFLPASVETPLEALLRKEEFMTGEPSDKARRTDDFVRWLERKQKSAFSEILI